LFAVLLFQPSLYPWARNGYSAPEHVSRFHEAWLSWPFFLVRAVGYLGAWFIFSFLIIRNSRRQDQTRDVGPTRNNLRLSAGFLVVFGVTCWLSSYDWIMSLEPEWSSTIFGVYNFAGMFLSALAGVTLLAVCLRSRPPLKDLLTPDRWHDLGTLLFAFSSFWMYTWFCQYMLIWYTNHPEETAYLTRRWQGNWPVIGLLDLVLNWGIPFVVLLFRAAKRNPGVLAVIAIILLLGRGVDLYLMIFPAEAAATVPGLLETSVTIGAMAAFGLVILYALGQASLVPSNEANLAPTNGRVADARASALART
jgi:hypothetical protein